MREAESIRCVEETHRTTQEKTKQAKHKIGYAKTEFMGYQWYFIVWGLDVGEFCMCTMNLCVSKGELTLRNGWYICNSTTLQL